MRETEVFFSGGKRNVIGVGFFKRKIGKGSKPGKGGPSRKGNPFHGKRRRPQGRLLKRLISNRGKEVRTA